MATYNSLTSRTEVQPLIPEVVSNRINKIATQKSFALSLFPNVPMGTNQTRMPVISALPIAYFVSGDTGLMQTSEINWANKYLNVEEIAVIIPIPKTVLADMTVDTWGTAEPLIGEAVGRTLDAAVAFGTNKPSSWGSDLLSGASSGTVLNTVTLGANNTAAGGIAGDISDAMGKVEIDGFDPTALITDRLFRGKLRKARDTTGQRLLDVEEAGETFDGLPVQYAMRGLWPAQTSGNVAAFVGDFSQGIIGVRQDMTWELSDQAVITDASGLVIYNLFQQGMVAMKVTARYAWTMANIINHSELVEANRWPFASLLNA